VRFGGGEGAEQGSRLRLGGHGEGEGLGARSAIPF